MENDKLYKEFKRVKHLKLGASVVMDLLGMATFLIPGVAELADLVWAPVAAIVHFLLYRSWPGAAGGLVTFVEEILPVSDWVPSFTLNWIFHYMIREKKTLRRFLKRRQGLQDVLEENKPKELS